MGVILRNSKCKEIETVLRKNGNHTKLGLNRKNGSLIYLKAWFEGMNAIGYFRRLYDKRGGLNATGV